MSANGARTPWARLRGWKQQLRTRNRRWLGFLAMFVAVVVFASVVTADVVLSYGATGTVGANSATPFWFTNGADYNAVTTPFLAVTCAGGTPAAGTAGACGGTAQPTPSTAITLTLHGVESVNTYVVDMMQFNIEAGFPAGGGANDFWVPAVTGDVGTAWTGVTCAYAFISTVAPTINPSTLSATVPAGGGAPCNVFEPTVTGGDWQDFNLLTAASADPATCTGQAGVTYVEPAAAAPCVSNFYAAHAAEGATTTLLYISVVVGVSAAAPTGSTTVLFNTVAD